MTELSRRAVFAAAAGLLAARRAGADQGLDALLAEIAKARRALRTLKASFTQERKLALLATSVRSSGTLTFVAPDRLRWELAPPDDIVYWIGPEGLSYRTRSSKATASAQGAAVAKALGDVRALLGGDLGALRERYVLTAARSAESVEVTGSAKDPKASVKSFALVLDRSLVVPVRAQLVEGKRDAIDIVFSNVRVNEPVDPASMKP